MSKKRPAHRTKARIHKRIQWQDLPNRRFWALFGVLLLLSAVAIITSIDDPFLTGHAVAQSISFMKSGSELMFEVKNFGVKNITVQLLQEVKNGEIVLEEKDTIPFDGVAYSKFTVTSTEAEKFGDMELEFKVNKELLHQKAIFPQEVMLYVNGRAIPTAKMQKEETTYLYYAARLNRFETGNYVLGRANLRVASATPTMVISEPAAPEMEKVEEKPTESETQEPGPLPRTGWAAFFEFWKKLFN
ncbi:hypothetical protein HYU22_02355 [Candidatus Woesearchaeota archaeon]|nr:hypothetical protein [Candidatus Woesearchaeota archaeon]